MEMIYISLLFILNFLHLGFLCYFLLRISDYEADDLGRVECCRSINKFSYYDWFIYAVIVLACAATFSWIFLLLNLPVAFLFFQRASNGTYSEKDVWWRRGGHLDWGRFPQVVDAYKREVVILAVVAFVMFLVYFVALLVQLSYELSSRDLDTGTLLDVF
eukprot:TRINITY_DN5525_c0_g1_i1.p3 TRINITY_DN5525_c0_g1~~TRINITY_DN5525_c0_g1_i1.p3  ORF type:complete len:160 (-),score=31.81 TRINITY_DN5525_c0_g1_i1:237-716(-)